MNNRKSYEIIDYKIRPGKCAERKMLCDSWSLLGNLRPVSSYSYLGFGSTFFADFVLVHKNLGICDMVSMEKEVDDKERFEFNKPYNCIDIKYGLASEILASLSWDTPKIVWLDYDGHLSKKVLEDIQTVFSLAEVGSVVVITVNAHPDPTSDIEKIKTIRIDAMRKRLEEHTPSSIGEMNLGGWGTAKAYYQVAAEVIDQTISDRSSGYAEENQLSYKQLFHFRYADGAKMLTFGGMIVNSVIGAQTDGLFGDLEYIRTGAEAFDIVVPNLTLMEIRELDKLLPDKENEGGPEGCAEVDSESAILGILPKRDIDAYKAIYRFFPTFTETNL